MSNSAKKIQKKLTPKQLDKAIGDLYRIHGDSVQVMIMDLVKIYAQCRAAYAAGDDLEKAMVDAISQYRVN